MVFFPAQRNWSKTKFKITETCKWLRYRLFRNEREFRNGSCRAIYGHFSTNLGSDGHFDVLNGSKS